MEVKIHRIDPTLPLPVYQTTGAVGFDLYVRCNTTIAPQAMGRIPLNVIIEVPAGYLLYLKDRSSTLQKKGLLATAGIIDQDYHGPHDELLFQVYNPQAQACEVKRGERVAQGVFLQVGKAQWRETDFEKKTNRGGFGSTDEHDRKP